MVQRVQSGVRAHALREIGGRGEDGPRDRREEGGASRIGDTGAGRVGRAGRGGERGGGDEEEDEPEAALQRRVGRGEALQERSGVAPQGCEGRRRLGPRRRPPHFGQGRDRAVGPRRRLLRELRRWCRRLLSRDRRCGREHGRGRGRERRHRHPSHGIDGDGFDRGHGVVPLILLLLLHRPPRLVERKLSGEETAKEGRGQAGGTRHGRVGLRGGPSPIDASRVGAAPSRGVGGRRRRGWNCRRRGGVGGGGGSDAG
mmetsp:Transcript_39701/g.119300  ORF Transcript_39701/g.119300 Transcript_39701/m.119300 type:complete len:257 (-) Transcript_39701:3-773(-)